MDIGSRHIRLICTYIPGLFSLSLSLSLSLSIYLSIYLSNLSSASIATYRRFNIFSFLTCFFFSGILVNNHELEADEAKAKKTIMMYLRNAKDRLHGRKRSSGEGSELSTQLQSSLTQANTSSSTSSSCN